MNKRNSETEERTTKLSIVSSDVISSTPKAKSDLNADENRDCIICLESNADVVVLDCGHGGLCYDCAFKHWDRSQRCHICRKVKAS